MSIMHKLTEDEIETLKRLEKAFNDHDRKSCKVDCCIICYIEDKEDNE